MVLTSTLPRWHGDATPAFVLDLCRELAREFDVHVLAPHAAGARRREDLNGVSVHRFRYLPEAWQTLAYDGGIPERLRRRPLALLQVPFFLVGQFCAALFLSWSLRPELIHAHWVMPQGMLALLISRLSPGRLPVICTLHGTDVHGWNSGPLRWLKGLALRRSDLVTVVSDHLRTLVTALGVSPPRIHVAPMGVDTDDVFRSSTDSTRARGSAVFVGRLVAGKGVDVLLRAWARLSPGPDSQRLTVVGDGPERRALEAQAISLGLGNRVRFTGALPPPAVADQFRAAAVAVFPFTGVEGLGLVVAEAQACGCPVIASDIPAVRDSIVPEVTGLITPPGDVAALAESLQRVMGDPGLSERMARAGRVSALERFGWTRVGDQYRALIRGLIRAG